MPCLSLSLLFYFCLVWVYFILLHASRLVPTPSRNLFYF